MRKKKGRLILEMIRRDRGGIVEMKSDKIVQWLKYFQNNNKCGDGP